jgi:hypothetical protein
VAQAIVAEALREPGTARELSRRACVGERVGMYTVSRLLDAGQLVRVAGARPAVLVAPACAAVCLLAERPAEPPAVLLLGRLFPGVDPPALTTGGPAEAVLA